MNVADTQTVTLSSPGATSDAYTLNPWIRQCTVGSCSTTGIFSYSLSDGSPLPSWITDSSNSLTINPTDTSMISSTTTVKAVFTPDSGINVPEYNVYTITVSCDCSPLAWSGPTADTVTVQ